EEAAAGPSVPAAGQWTAGASDLPGGPARRVAPLPPCGLPRHGGVLPTIAPVRPGAALRPSCALRPGGVLPPCAVPPPDGGPLPRASWLPPFLRQWQRPIVPPACPAALHCGQGSVLPRAVASVRFLCAPAQPGVQPAWPAIPRAAG